MTPDGRPAVSIEEPVWARVLALLDGADEVALACHLNPDGDALGSMLGLGLALRARGVRAVASFGGGDVPPTYRMLPGLELVVAPENFPPAPAVLVTLDTSSRERLGDLEPVVDKADEVLIIDHHIRGDDFGTVALVDPRAAATAAVVEELVRRLGVPLTPDIATCLYTGLTTDTGSFKYASTTPAVHQLAARLLATGIRHDVISRRIWDTNPVGYLRVLGRALERVQVETDAVGGLGLVWTETTVEDLRETGLLLAEIEGIIDVVRTVDTAEVAVVCKGDVDGTLKVSTRSKGRIDVGAVCEALGGGGHRFAAGLTSYAEVDATIGRIRDALATAPHLPE